MEKRSTLYALLIFGGLLALCFTFAIVLFRSLGAADEAASGWSFNNPDGPKVGVVEINGVITESKDALGQLVQFRRDPSIKAIVVRINSPGGAVAPSQELFHALERARRDKKVVVSMGTLCASGGFYIAVGADRIVASPGTITGSIGVVSQFPDVSGLLDLLRIRATTVKSGALKDVGSPIRPMTQGELEFFQGFSNRIYEQFLTDVSTARKVPKEELRKIADGRVLSGQEALEAKLIDQIGNFEDALETAVKLAGAPGDPVPVFAKKRESLVRELLHEGTEGAAQAIKHEFSPSGSVELRDTRLQ